MTFKLLITLLEACAELVELGLSVVLTAAQDDYNVRDL